MVATQPIGNTKRHGGGKYGEIVFRQIIKKHFPIECYYDSRKWFNPEMETLIKEQGIKLHDISKTTLDKLVKESNCDCIYSALPQRDLFLFDKCKIIGTIHGLRTLETPVDPECLQYAGISIRSFCMFLYKKYFGNLYKKSLIKYKEKEWSNPHFQFVTVSYHSQCAIRAYFPSFVDKEIPVFYSPSTSSNKLLDTKFTEKYFMLVSGKLKDKNNLRAVKALDKLFDYGYLRDFKVKITGAASPNVYKYKIHNPERFEFLGYVDDDVLEQLYHDAFALIYPSLNEGFGYPPLEAMHYGVPVLASPYTSIPEVCEGAALYFNPFSVEEIAARILRISDKKIRKEFSERALKQFSKITEKQVSDLDALIDYIYK